MKTRMISINSFLLIAAALIFALSININAQHRDNGNRDKGHQKVKKEVVVKHHDKYKDIVVKDRHYFYCRGYFYDRGPQGYIKIAAPIGARITLLPRGYKVVRVHRVRYYLFGGIYYRFLPEEKVYVVVEVPL